MENPNQLENFLTISFYMKFFSLNTTTIAVLRKAPSGKYEKPRLELSESGGRTPLLPAR